MAAALTYDTLLPEIRTLSYKLQTGKKTKTWFADRKKLRDRLSTFFDRCVRVRVRRANNEKHPWTDAEIGMECLGMETKAITGTSQIGDYQFEISINGGAWFNLGLCLERKEKEDAHSTFLFNLERFANELERFEDAEHLWQFRIIVESSLDDYLSYVHPLPRICKCCEYCHAYHDTHNNVHKYSCVYDVIAKRAELAKVVRPTYQCRCFSEKLKTFKEVEDLRTRKLSLVESFEADGYSVSFYSNRKRAAGAIKTIVKRFFVANYVRLLQV